MLTRRQGVPARHRSIPSKCIDMEDTMQVREIMTPAVTTVPPNAPVVDVARIMRDEDIGSVPVAENERLLGMVTDRDIVVRAVSKGQDGIGCTASDVMTPDVRCCMADDD